MKEPVVAGSDELHLNDADSEVQKGRSFRNLEYLRRLEQNYQSYRSAYFLEWARHVTRRSLLMTGKTDAQAIVASTPKNKDSIPNATPHSESGDT